MEEKKEDHTVQTELCGEAAAATAADPPKEKILEKFERAQELIKKMEDVENRLNEKIKEFDAAVAEKMLNGETLAGRAVQETEDEKIKRECNKLLEGSGYQI